jgi:hypothetical protein
MVLNAIVTVMLWHIDPLLGNDRKISSYITAVASQWVNNYHVGIPEDAIAAEERCVLRGPCREVISRTDEDVVGIRHQAATMCCNELQNG